MRTEDEKRKGCNAFVIHSLVILKLVYIHKYKSIINNFPLRDIIIIHLTDPTASNQKILDLPSENRTDMFRQNASQGTVR